MIKSKYLSALLVCAMAAGVAYAQINGLKRELVLKSDVTVPNHEAVVARAEIAPGIVVGRHTHPGDEISFVMEGEGELLIDGEPPRKLKAGEAFVIPAGKIHAVKSTDSVPMKLVGTFVVEKGKPLATPAPTESK